jgi:uncharacterized protein (DUF2141 family)
VTGAGGVATVTTNESGRFTFKDIAAGNYSIRARRDGFFGTTSNGATAPMQNMPVITSPAQPDAAVQILLVAGASVGGRVTHSNDRPAPEARISAIRFRYAGGETTMATFGNAITDAEGNFRISGIEPGELYLRAAVVRNAAGESIPATVTYFPSARAYSSGTLLSAAAGVELIADIQLVEGIRRRISGRVIGADPAVGVVFALLPQGATVDNLEAGMSRNIAAANGSFQMETMRPGVYDLVAYTNSSSGRARVDLRDQDVSDVSITLTPTVELEIRFTGEQADTYTRGGIALAPVETPLPTALRPRSTAGFTGRGQASQTFTNIPEGKYSLTIPNRGNDATYIADIVQGGKSILDSGVITIGAEEPAPVEVRTAAGGGVIEGTVQIPAAGTPATPVVVVAIPEGMRRQNLLLYARMQIAVARLRGPLPATFRILGVTPGRYKVFAFGNSPDPSSEQNADFMKPYEQFGIPVEVTLNGAAAAITVPLIR